MIKKQCQSNSLNISFGTISFSYNDIEYSNNKHYLLSMFFVYFTSPRDIHEATKKTTSTDTNIQSTSQHFATSKSSSTSSSLSSVDQSLPERNTTKGVFSTQSSLGDLPPLGGAIGASSRNTLAPLKKIPSGGSSKPLDNNPLREQKNLGVHGK